MRLQDFSSTILQHLNHEHGIFTPEAKLGSHFGSREGTHFNQLEIDELLILANP